MAEANVTTTSCRDCGCEGVVCATPAGEIQLRDLSLVSVADVLAERGLEILCASAHGTGDAVCDSCEDARAQEVRS